MAVDLSQYVPLVKAAVSAPGTDAFPDSLSSDWVAALRNAFWDAYLDGFLTGWAENADNNSPGIVVPVAPNTTDLPRQLVQLVIFYAAISAVLNQIRQLRTQFKVGAGGVTYEYTQSANALRDALKILDERRKQLYYQLSTSGSRPNIGYSDCLYSRDIATYTRQIWWER